METPRSLICELEVAVQSGSHDQRLATLRRVTDLFLASADRFDRQQIGLFDDVLLHLTRRIEHQALAELSARLAPVDGAPAGVVRHLARHENIAVAAPMLTLSAGLSDDDLVDIAQTRSQQHLWAISGRASLNETVTDVLVERGDQRVVHKLVKNPGAAFSQTGFSTMIGRAGNDDYLAENLGLRLDIPPHLLGDLMTKATETVRARLLASAPLESREEIHRVLSSVSNDVGRAAAAPRDFEPAADLVLRLQRGNQLDEAAILEFARARKYEEMVAGLARLCSAPIEPVDRLMQSARCDGLLVVCKAARLEWRTVTAILGSRFAYAIGNSELEQAKADFTRLTPATAQRVLRFWLVRETALARTG